MEIVSAANTRILKYVPGARTMTVGPLYCIHYERPLWWETDAFQVIDVEPDEVLEHIRAYRPGPHLIAVITIEPDAVIAPHAALGYKTVPNEPVETVMARRFDAFSAAAESRFPVQQVRSENQRQFYNSVIDVDDPHCQIRPEELADPEIRYYYVEQDGRCVCNARAILPELRALNIEPLSTHPDYRRRGIATALMNRIHTDAAQLGAGQSVIVASQMGIALYSTLGYRVVCYIQKLVPMNWK
jgi:GNAT superfamily N-acetyltransferase